MSENIVAGIDEAGYGPILGPLVVSMAIFDIGSRTLDTSIERVMRDSLSRSAKKEEIRVRVDDSKKIYGGANGFFHLEKTALAFYYAMAGRIPAFLGDWLERAAPPDLGECPWYGPAPLSLHLPLKAAPSLVEACGRRIRNEMEREGFPGFRFSQQVLTAPAFNRGVERLGLKSEVLWRAIIALIQGLNPLEEERNTRIDVDKLGGRTFYGSMVRMLFPKARFQTETESRSRSSYRVDPWEGGILRLAFHQGGDAKLLPIALASILSKYTRELFMHLFNRFWLKRAPSLKPTAGYPVDGTRFLRDIEEVAKVQAFGCRAFLRGR